MRIREARGFGLAIALAIVLVPPRETIVAQRTASSAVKVSGEGTDTWVLITGVIGSVAGYRKLESRLQQLGKRVVIIDPYLLSLDSGDVSFDALARRTDAILAAHDVRSAHVVGHAHGGAVAIRLAANAPDRVSELFLLNVGAIADNHSPVFASSMRFVPLITRLPRGRDYVRRKIIAGIRENSGRADWLDEHAASAYADPILDNIHRVIAMAHRLTKATEPEPLSRVVGRIHVPVTMILGALSCPASPGKEELAALEPLGSLVRTYRVPGTCHFPHEEAPAEVMQQLLLSRSS